MPDDLDTLATLAKTLAAASAADKTEIDVVPWDDEVSLAAVLDEIACVLERTPMIP